MSEHEVWMLEASTWGQPSTTTNNGDGTFAHTWPTMQGPPWRTIEECRCVVCGHTIKGAPDTSICLSCGVPDSYEILSMTYTFPSPGHEPAEEETA